MSKGIAAGLSVPTSGGASAVQGGYVAAVPEEGCGFVSDHVLADLLQDNIANQLNSHEIKNGFEQLTCYWSGVPNVPGHNRGGPVRGLSVNMDRMHAYGGRSERQAVTAATEFFDQKYTASTGWKPFDLAGADSSWMFWPGERPDAKEVTYAVRHENVLIEVKYSDGGASQESVERDAGKVLRYVLAHVR